MSGGGAEYQRLFGSEKPIGAFAQVNSSYSWGHFWGTTSKPPNNQWIIVPRMGLYWDFNGQFFLKMGYSYTDTKTDDLKPHRLFISATLTLSTIKNIENQL